MTIDPKGDGKTALKVFYGRYYMNFADAFSVANPGGASYKVYQFLNTAGDGLYHGPQDLGKLVSASGGGVGTFVDPNLQTPYTDQLNVSIERQFWGESSVRLAYVRNMSRNMFTGGGYSPNGALNTAWVGQFTVPTEVQVATATGTQTMTLNDVPSSVANSFTPEVTGHAERHRQLELQHDRARVQQAVRHGDVHRLELRLHAQLRRRVAVRRDLRSAAAVERDLAARLLT